MSSFFSSFSFLSSINYQLRCTMPKVVLANFNIGNCSFHRFLGSCIHTQYFLILLIFWATTFYGPHHFVVQRSEVKPLQKVMLCECISTFQAITECTTIHVRYNLLHFLLFSQLLFPVSLLLSPYFYICNNIKLSSFSNSSISF